MNRITLKLLTLITALTFCGVARPAFALETRSESTECSSQLCLDSNFQPLACQITCLGSQQPHLAKSQDTSTDIFGGDDDDARLRRPLKNINRKIEPKVKDQYLSSALISSKAFSLSGLRNVHNDGLSAASNSALIRIRTVILIC
jgi:hypothetical protein